MKKGRKVRSMRGEVVDFDLAEIKNQMTNQPKSDEVKKREDYIDSRLRRRSARRAQAIADQNTKENETSTDENKEEVSLPVEQVEEKTEAPKPTRSRRIKKKEDN